MTLFDHNPWANWVPKRELLEQFTIYYSPVDLPGRFVVRRFEIGPGGSIKPCEGVIAPTLGAARACVPEQLHCIDRDPSDPPSIVETWW